MIAVPNIGHLNSHRQKKTRRAKFIKKIPPRSGPTADALTSRHFHVYLTQRAAPNCRNTSDRLFPSLTFWRPQSDDVTKPRTRRELNSTLEQSYDGFILKHVLKHVLDLRERSAPLPWVLDLHQSSIDSNVACWALLGHVGEQLCPKMSHDAHALLPACRSAEGKWALHKLHIAASAHPIRKCWWRITAVGRPQLNQIHPQRWYQGHSRIPLIDGLNYTCGKDTSSSAGASVWHVLR